MTRIAEVMTRGVRTVAPGDGLVQAARAMAELDVGAVPVCDGERLVGIVTDRDITVRGVAQELPLHLTRIVQVMSTEPQSCRPDDALDQVIARMKQSQIRRLPVVDAEDRLVGIVSLGDVALQAPAADAGSTLAAISEPGEADDDERSSSDAGYDAAAAQPLDATQPLDAADDDAPDTGGPGHDGTGPATARPAAVGDRPQ